MPRWPAVLPTSRSSTPRRARRTALVAVAVAAAAGVSFSPAAQADPSNDLRDAVAAVRGSASCGPLRYNPTVEKVAGIANRTTEKFFSLEADAVPVEDPVPTLKDLGYGGNKAILLRGAYPNSDASAIKGTILQGYGAIPDCSYTEFGTDLITNTKDGYSLAAVVLAGP